MLVLETTDEVFKDRENNSRAQCGSICIFSGGVTLGASVAASTRESRSGNPTAIVEQGKFILHKFENPIGEETYQIVRDGKSLAVKMDFKFTDRGTPVPLSATFRSSEDLTPEAFEIKGQNSRSTSIDEAVEVQPNQVRLRDREKWTEVCAAFAVLHHRRLRSHNHADADGSFLGYAQLARRVGHASFRSSENRASRTGRDQHRWKKRNSRSLHHRRPDLGTRNLVV